MKVGVATFQQSINQTNRIKDLQVQFDDLSLQLSTGKITQEFTGLDTDILISKRSRADIGKLDTYIDNIDNSTRRINLMVGSIEEYKVQGETLFGNMTLFPQESTHTAGEKFIFENPAGPPFTIEGVTSADMSVEFDALTALADDLFDVMTELINTRDGNRFLFAGAGIFTQPVGNSGLLDSHMNNLIDQWKGGTLSTEQLISALQTSDPNVDANAVSDTIVGYSSELSAGNSDDVFVVPDDNTELDYTVLGNADPFRDILVAMSFLKNPNLPPIADVYPPGSDPLIAPTGANRGAPGVDLQGQVDSFYQVFNELTGMVNDALNQLDTENFRISNVAARIQDIKLSHEASTSMLENTISSVEDPDLNVVAVTLSSLQQQLDASYRITARVQELSLVNFI